MFCEVYHRIHPTFLLIIFDYRAQTETDHRRKGIIQRLFVVKIVVRIHRLIDDAIHFNRPVFRTFIGMIQPDALSAVVANLRWIEIAHVAFATLDAHPII